MLCRTTGLIVILAFCSHKMFIRASRCMLISIRKATDLQTMLKQLLLGLPYSIYISTAIQERCRHRSRLLQTLSSLSV